MRRWGGFGEIYAAGGWLWLGGNMVLAAGLLGRLDRAGLALLGALIAAGLVAIAWRARGARWAVARAARAHPALFATLLLVIGLEAIPALAPRLSWPPARAPA
jgi:hypothetical protein